MSDKTTFRTTPRDTTFVHVLLIAVVSFSFEFAFVGTNLNMVDEGWPLYAAMQLHDGGTLYENIFFVFPPGHLLVAYIAYGIDPPGVYVARLLYATFDIALAIALYFLGRRVMPAHFAWVGALLLAVAAESAHHKQLLFGYRYLVISVLALIAFARYLEARDRRFLFAAGTLTGIALAFRLTPAFATGCGIAVGLLASSRKPRVWLQDGAVFGAGLLLAVIPVLAWIFQSVSPETLWREVVVRPVMMTNLQSLPIPDWLWLPEKLTRRYIHEWFVVVQFRAYILLYIGYGLGITLAWMKDLRAGRAFSSPLLVALVAWGAVYFGRSFGRSDAPHLYSALPPICLLLAHAAWMILRTDGTTGNRIPRRARIPLAAAALAVWVFLMGSDRIFWPGHLGRQPLASLGGRIGVKPDTGLLRLDHHIQTIARLTRPGDTILDLSASSLFHVISQRPGPGRTDIIMPGTFLDEAEERRFVERLAAHPPALVIFPGWLFDDRKDRTVQASAPILWNWVRSRYQRIGPYERYVLMLPKERLRRHEKSENQGSTDPTT